MWRGCDIQCKTMVRAGFLQQPCGCWEILLFFPPSLRQSFPAMGPPECVLNTLKMALRQKEFLGISLFPTSGQAGVIRKHRGPARGLASKIPWDCLGDPSITWLQIHPHPP